MKERLNKIIAKAGICSRRKADELIAAGKVSVNGNVVRTLGETIDPRQARISVNGQDLHREQYVYIMLHKPVGCTSTTADKFAEKTVLDLLPKFPARIYPVGRLDKNTSGLLLLTNDGELTQKLLHPKFEVVRAYEVTLKGKLEYKTIDTIEKGGLEIEDYKTSPCRISIISRSAEQSRIIFRIQEGRKREIRKIFGLCKHPVMELKRIQFGKLKLGNLPCGKWERIKKSDIL